MNEISEHSVENTLRAGLARGDAVIGSLGPALRHLLASDDNSLFSDEIIARIRGMAESLAQQLLVAFARSTGSEDARSLLVNHHTELTETLLSNPALLGHLHALALEWQLTQRIQQSSNVDPVLSPLLQSLIASSDAEVASTAMAFLAAQARFVQSQRRMEHGLTELPGDLLHTALLAFRAKLGAIDDQAAELAEAELRKGYDESRTRLTVIARLVAGLGDTATMALLIGQAGAALFLSALALGSGQDRDLAVIAANHRQAVRLALSLRAAGLDPRQVEEQFLVLQPETALPFGFEQVSADRAATLLAPVGEGDKS